MKTILILDDDPSVRESFSGFFEDRLWHTVSTASAEEALELLKKEQPLAAIVDDCLPGMDGASFIRTAMKQKLLKAFVICTGSPGYDVPHDLLKLPGVSSYLHSKPVFDLDALEKEILHVLAGIESTKQGRSEWDEPAE